MQRPSTRPRSTTSWSGPPVALRGRWEPPRVELPPVPTAVDVPPPEPSRWETLRLPALLYLLTCLSTLLVAGPVYAVAVMLILSAHEAGHYVMARRWRVAASLPYFLPMPFSPIGTMGAVIRMRAFFADRRALFDIAVAGPLAGLVPALVASAIGIRLSTVISTADMEAGASIELGEPLVFKLLSYLLIGPLPEGQTLLLHPLAFAGWVGIFITALNLLPIGQLDGGHLLYALLRRRAHTVAQGLMAASLVAMVVGQYWMWALMWTLILVLGVRHPPTADDSVPLGTVRTVLGWLTLAFLIAGFTPTPLVIPPPPGVP